jgi:tetratricopeptide (TPR) repeat protein
MLFDLRGRGRRRAVQAIYLSLALLMGGGLVLFGIGGATSGGLLDAFKGSAGTQSTNDIFQKRVNAAEKAVKLRPADPKAWAELTRVRYQQAGSGDGFNQVQNVFTDKGKTELRGAQAAWNRYIKLTPKPDDSIASLMVQAFGPEGLDQPDQAVSAMEIVLDRREPTGPLYVQLAALAYQAGQTRKAELASKKALSLTPKDSQEQIKAQLQNARLAASASLGQDAAGTSTTGTTATTTTTPSS